MSAGVSLAFSVCTTPANICSPADVDIFGAMFTSLLLENEWGLLQFFVLGFFDRILAPRFGIFQGLGVMLCGAQFLGFN